jgi:hypothetical protein
VEKGSRRPEMNASADLVLMRYAVFVAQLAHTSTHYTGESTVLRRSGPPGVRLTTTRAALSVRLR